MTSHRTAAHALAGISALVVTVGVLSGCTPEPDPTPTPTAAFASEEEAFAAAEEVYRAYNDAGNARLRGEQSPDPQDFLIGTVLEDDIDGLELLRASGLQLVGEISVPRFTGQTAELEASGARVVAIVCLDVSGTRVVNVDGADVTPAERPAKLSQEVTMVYADGSYLITEQAEAEAESC